LIGTVENHGKNTANFGENHKNHGKESASNHGLEDRYTVYETRTSGIDDHHYMWNCVAAEH